MIVLKTTLLGLFFGTLGTTIGGCIGCFFNKVSNKFLSFILSFASGLMMAVVCFDLIPEALQISNILITISGIFLGILIMIVSDIIIENRFYKKNNDLLKTGIIITVGLAIHNFPEGLAIGSGFDISTKLGFGLAISICLHDIPEGISMAIPMKSSGMDKWKVILYVIFSGATTGIGAFLGVIIGEISNSIISIALGFAAGCMLYIISADLIPESNKLYSGKLSSLGNILGVIAGIFANKV